METIEVGEDTSRSNGVVLRIGDFEDHMILTPPFDDEQEAELDWYFEQHLSSPFTDQERAREAAESITTYGEMLFEQLFASDQARSAYDDVRRRAYPHSLAIAIVGSPAFQVLHWEALKDPKLRPFALDVPMVRRLTVASPPIDAIAAEYPTLNLLVVTARPGDAPVVGYRTITRPLIETLHRAQLKVEVDLVRPGTWKALVQQLEGRPPGYYHAAHFDLHGGLLAYEEFVIAQTVAGADRLTSGRWGRGGIQPYEGVRAFLSFENETDSRTDLAEAGEVAHLLLKHNTLIAILNACQSGKQVGTEETALGARLLRAGVQSIVAMAWSVTVSAAELLVPVLYSGLFAGKPLGLALLAARRALWADKGRPAVLNNTIELEDWLLPVVYQNREPKLSFRAFTPDEARTWRKARETGLREVKTDYRFVGRDLDVLQIEKALLTRRNILLVQGMAGSGKTALLRHLAQWEGLTGLVEGAFYFGWDECTWTRGQILRTLAPELLRADVAAGFAAMPEPAQEEVVADVLLARRHLLILDNLEILTCEGVSNPKRPSDEQREELRSFIEALSGGATLVLLGSRSEDAGFARGTFEDNVHRLEGLDPEAARDLADAILQRAGAPLRCEEESSFDDLMRSLSGHPLTLQIVLPHLTSRSAAEVLEALQEGLAWIDADGGPSVALAKTRSLRACIKYGYDNLDSEEQELLVCFAPFMGIINTNLLSSYVRELAKEPVLHDLPLDRLGKAVESARRVGLVQRDEAIARFVRRDEAAARFAGPAEAFARFVCPAPALAWFLRSLLATPEQGEPRAAVERAFRRFYDGYASSLFSESEAKEPERRRMAQFGLEQEYINLGTALRLALQQGGDILRPYLALCRYLDSLQDNRRALELGEMVLRVLSRRPAEAMAGWCGAEVVGVVEGIARRQLAGRRFEEAEAGYQKALALLDGLENLDGGDADEELALWERAGIPHRTAAAIVQQMREQRRTSLTAAGRASMLHQLGIVAQEQRRFADAETHYKQALEILIGLDDRDGAAGIYHQLGTIAQEQRRFADAESYYQHALKDLLTIGDHRRTATIYHQLGTLAHVQRRFSDADRNYWIALTIKLSFKDDHDAASTYHQLGIVAREQRQFAKAEDHYKAALGTFLIFEDRHSAAHTYYHLAIVMREQRRWADAEGYYKQSVEIFKSSNDQYQLASVYHGLGIVARERSRFAEAEGYYQQALEMYLNFDDWHCAADIYHGLSIVALEQREFASAEDHCERALEIYLRIDDRHATASICHLLGTVVHEQGRFAEAEGHHQKALEMYLEFNDFHSAAGCYHGLGRVAQEQRGLEKAEAYFRTALAIYVACEDGHRGRIVLRSFARLWYETGADTVLITVKDVLDTTLAEAERVLKSYISV